jgi:hypothetical protein
MAKYNWSCVEKDSDLYQKKKAQTQSRRKASGQVKLSFKDVFNAGHGIGPDGEVLYTRSPCTRQLYLPDCGLLRSRYPKVEEGWR